MVKSEVILDLLTGCNESLSMISRRQWRETGMDILKDDSSDELAGLRCSGPVKSSFYSWGIGKTDKQVK